MVVVGAVMGKPDSADAELFRLVVTGEVQLAVSDDLLSELVRVMHYPYVESRINSPGRAFEVAVDLMHMGSWYRPWRLDWPSLRDLKDWWVLDLDFESGADYVVTRDPDLLEDAPPLGFEVRTPAEFLTELRSWFTRRSFPTERRTGQITA
jgi:putative PIN family toxin of toxin-antitoxin system